MWSRAWAFDKCGWCTCCAGARGCAEDFQGGGGGEEEVLEDPFAAVQVVIAAAVADFATEDDSEVPFSTGDIVVVTSEVGGA